jgi:antitoxin MazE
MPNVITTRIVKIGNSQGIRIPKPLLEQAGLSGEVSLEVEGDRLILRPARVPRQGWDAHFQRMHECGDDVLLDEPPLLLTAWEENEWEW